MSMIDIDAQVDHSTVLRLEREVLRATPARLRISRSHSAVDPLSRVATYQLLTSLSRQAKKPVLELDVSGEAELYDLVGSDPLAFAAVSLADGIEDADGRQVSSYVWRELASLRRQHAALFPWSAWGISETRVAVARFDPLSEVGSPEFGTRNKRGWSTDFAARTLFTPVSLEAVLDDERDEVLSHTQNADHEVTRTSIYRRVLQRRTWPAQHPLSSRDIEFQTVGDRLLPVGEQGLAVWRARHAADSSPSDWLGHALYELVQNAERHATKSVDGSAIASPATIVIADRFGSGELEIERCTQSLQNYLEGQQAQEFVAVTVLDCGDGLGATAAWRSTQMKELSAADEAGYLRSAVSGTLRERSGPLHGFGLPLVQHLVSDLGGMVHVRSGQTVVYRDFRRSPYAIANDDRTAWLHDESDEVEGYLRKGTAFTMIVPRVDS